MEGIMATWWKRELAVLVISADQVVNDGARLPESDVRIGVDDGRKTSIGVVLRV